MWTCLYVYLSAEAQRCASSSWFGPLLFLQSPVWPRLDCLLVPSLCDHSHPTYIHKKNTFSSTHRHSKLSKQTEKLTKANKKGKLHNPGIYTHTCSMLTIIKQKNILKQIEMTTFWNAWNKTCSFSFVNLSMNQMDTGSWFNSPGKRAAASLGSRRTGVWAHRQWRGVTPHQHWSSAQSDPALWRHLIWE